ncbi:MAG TPA: cytochrome c4 [Methylibium sp.]|uniref:c-type cytochrome n=1 Tax=Methylibium sp. TaxID=2067992 RepID=UPI002DBBFE83|nr:cytochrome c4 [Methylibium sp.]HEU4458017.1 cytochrome c4 [Methylibium sp.]
MRALRVLAAVVLLAGAGRAASAQQPAPDNPAAGVQDTMAQRMQACVVCHGKEGRATNAGYFPRIAGKPAGYLHNQLRNFKEGRRRHAAMHHLVQHMSDDYMREIAQYFAALDLPYPPAQPAALTPARIGLAQRLIRDGAPERGIPACAACHGETMAGKLPAMPGLLTLPGDYLIAQFGAWRTGQRRAHEPDCMGEVARRLTPDEITAVARWLSAQTLPLGTEPEPASRAPLPLACGNAAP